VVSAAGFVAVGGTRDAVLSAAVFIATISSRAVGRGTAVTTDEGDCCDAPRFHPEPFASTSCDWARHAEVVDTAEADSAAAGLHASARLCDPAASGGRDAPSFDPAHAEPVASCDWEVVGAEPAAGMRESPLLAAASETSDVIGKNAPRLVTPSPAPRSAVPSLDVAMPVG